MATEKKIKISNSRIEEEIIYENVLLHVPNLKDIHMTWIPGHHMVIEGKQTLIPEHYRRGHKYGDNNYVTINYYDIGEKVGETIIADVKLIYAKNKKTDKTRFILDVYPAKPGNLPGYRLKIGSPTGETRHLIPGTESKYIRFQEI